MEYRGHDAAPDERPLDHRNLRLGWLASLGGEPG